MSEADADDPTRVGYAIVINGDLELDAPFADPVADAQDLVQKAVARGDVPWEQAYDPDDPLGVLAVRTWIIEIQCTVRTEVIETDAGPGTADTVVTFHCDDEDDRERLLGTLESVLATVRKELATLDAIRADEAAEAAEADMDRQDDRTPEPAE